MNDTFEEKLAVTLFAYKAGECRTKEDMIAFCEDFVKKNKPAPEPVPEEPPKEPWFQPAGIAKRGETTSHYGMGVSVVAECLVDDADLLAGGNLVEDRAKKELIEILTRQLTFNGFIKFLKVRDHYMARTRHVAELVVIPYNQKAGCLT